MNRGNGTLVAAAAAAGAVVGAAAAVVLLRRAGGNKSPEKSGNGQGKPQATGKVAREAAQQVDAGAGARSGYYIGVDVGGTTVAVALVDAGGTVAALERLPIQSGKRSLEDVVSLVCAAVRKTVGDASTNMFCVRSIGVGAPGLLDYERGRIISIANFDWRDAPLTELISSGLEYPASQVHLENDANAALLAEAWVGAARGKRHVLMLTLGTGVGGAVLSDGQLIRGRSGDAAELGHMILYPDGRSYGSTGVAGIFEAYASARAVGDRAAEALRSKPDEESSLRGVGGAEGPSCKDVFEHAERGDAMAQALVEDTARYLGIGCINFCRAFDPEIVILTGGMTSAGERLLEPLRRHYCAYHWNISDPEPERLQLAQCGNDAGAVGAAAAGFLKVHGSF